MDLAGPYKVPGLGEVQYMISFVDDYSGKGTSYPLRNKSNLAKSVELHVQRVSVFPANPRVSIGHGSHFHSDNEIITKAAEVYCATISVSQSSTPPHTPQMNPVPESYFNVILGYVRVMLVSSKLGLQFWSLAWMHAEYLHERSPSSVSPHHRPIELYGQKQSAAQLNALSKLPPFGVKAFVSVSGHEGNKLSPKARMGFFVGVSVQRSSVIIFYPDTNTCVFSAHVRFGGFAHAEPFLQQPSTYLSDIMSFACAPINRLVVPPAVNPLVGDRVAPQPVAPAAAPDGPVLVPVVDAKAQAAAMGGQAAHQHLPVYHNSGNVQPIDDLLADAAEEVIPDLEDGLEDDESFPSPHSSRNSIDVAMLTELVVPDVKLPHTYAEALRSSEAAQWEEGMEVQLAAFHKYGTFQAISSSDLLSTDKPIHSMVVFKKKHAFLDTPAKYKVRLVVCGNEQKEGVHFNLDDIHSPVASIIAGRMVLSILAVTGSSGKLLDIEQAFLQGDLLTQRIVVQLPRGVQYDGSSLVLMLRSSFGLHQAPKDWYIVVVRVFTVELGMLQSIAEPCLFIHGDGADRLLCTIVVDDLTVVCNDSRKLAWFEASLRTRFSLSKSEDFGEKPVMWLGLEVAHNRERHMVTITGTQYINRLLAAHNMSTCKPAPSPMPSCTDLLQEFLTLPKLDKRHSDVYQSVTGSLIYLAYTARPDISFAANSLAQFMSPTKTNKVHYGAMVSEIIKSSYMN